MEIYCKDIKVPYSVILWNCETIHTISDTEEKLYLPDKYYELFGKDIDENNIRLNLLQLELYNYLNVEETLIHTLAYKCGKLISEFGYDDNISEDLKVLIITNYPYLDFDVWLPPFQKFERLSYPLKYYPVYKYKQNINNSVEDFIRQGNLAIINYIATYQHKLDDKHYIKLACKFNQTKIVEYFLERYHYTNRVLIKLMLITELHVILDMIFSSVLIELNYSEELVTHFYKIGYFNGLKLLLDLNKLSDEYYDLFGEYDIFEGINYYHNLGYSSNCSKYYRYFIESYTVEGIFLLDRITIHQLLLVFDERVMFFVEHGDNLVKLLVKSEMEKIGNIEMEEWLKILFI